MFVLYVTVVTAYGAVNVQHVADDFTDYQSCASFATAWSADLPQQRGDTVKWDCRREEPWSSP
jgi:hypothetical protein